MNGEADLLATSSQKIYPELLYAPIPLFCMNDFTIHLETDGWIESNVMHFIDILSARKTATALGIGHDLRMSTWAHDPGPHPTFLTSRLSQHTQQLFNFTRDLASLRRPRFFTREGRGTMTCVAWDVMRRETCITYSSTASSTIDGGRMREGS